LRKLDGAKISALRKQRGWDQYELASAANIAPSVVSRLERNMQIDFKLSIVDAVAAALGVPIDSLLERSKSVETKDLVPELQILLSELRRQPPKIQRHVAGIIRGYLFALEADNEPIEDNG
jgi:transcriptional regulator with XRE-family HTH domain